jgi:murein DD-endopeptidase MepM/ murein hydrolase activator NlpD
MKKITASVFQIFICTSSLTLFSQDLNREYGGEFQTEKNNAAHPCASPELYKTMEKQIAEAHARFGMSNSTHKNASTTTFSWPLKTANGLNDCSYYYVANFLDQDPAAGTIKDYLCGSQTYDGHQGTDITLAPYPFIKMNNNQVQVIAAATGTIVTRVDGNFDKNCAGNALTPNYIIIEHADGSCAIYLHMKMSSLTPKVVGQTVVTGEYIGVAASSGSSSGPHLHFEVWAGTTVSTLNDAWTGACNSLNASSWWVAQKPKTEPAVIKIQVNTIAPVFPACPTTETSNEDSCFAGGSSAKFYSFIRNETTGLTAVMKILSPGGATFSTWTHNSVNTYISPSYYFQTRVLPNTAGTYTFQATYNGLTCSKTFTVNCGASGVSQTSEVSNLNVYPNPAINKVTLQSSVEIGLVTIYNSLGESVYKSKINNQNSEIDVADLARGIYILYAQGKHVRLVKE